MLAIRFSRGMYKYVPLICTYSRDGKSHTNKPLDKNTLSTNKKYKKKNWTTIITIRHEPECQELDRAE